MKRTKTGFHLGILVIFLITSMFLFPDSVWAKDLESQQPPATLADYFHQATFQSDELPDELETAFLDALNRAQKPGLNERWDIIDFQVQGNWAAGYAMLSNIKVEGLGSTAFNLIAKYDTAFGWQAITFRDGDWLTWIGDAPEELFSLEMKEYLRSQITDASELQGVGTTAAVTPTYYFPWLAGTKAALSRGHHDGYNVDFLLGKYPGSYVGESVAASADGKVIYAKWTGKSTCICKAWKNGSCTGGWVYPNSNTSCPWTEANSVRILHSDGSVTFYLHMAYNSLPDKFKRNYSTQPPVLVQHGEIIGLEGSTGWSTGAHLHFGVYKSNNVASTNSKPFTIYNNGATISSSSMVNPAGSRKSWTSYNYMVPEPPVQRAPLSDSSTFGTPVVFVWDKRNTAGSYYLEYSGPVSGTSGWISTTTYSAVLPTGSYTWRIKARNAGGEGKWSPSLTFIVQPEVPGIPSLSSPPADATTGQDVLLTWDVVDTATEYYLEYDGPMTGNSGWIPDTTFQASSLMPGAYTWHVKARNENGEGEWSETWGFTVYVDTDVPLVPGLISPANSGAVLPTVDFAWQDVGNDVEYFLEYSGASPVDSGWVTETTYSASGLPEGLYTWRVKARNVNGESDWSEVWSFTVQSESSVPGAPALTAPADAARVDSTLQLEWNGVAGATEYYMEYSGTASGNSGWIAGQSFTLQSLPTGSYTWRVKARNAGGEGGWSQSRTFVVVSTPATPTLVLPANNTIMTGITSVSFSWNTSANSTEYYVEYSGAKTGNSGWIASTSFTASALPTGTYTWRVKARNADRESAWSEVRSFVLQAAPAPMIVNPALTPSYGATCTTAWYRFSGAGYNGTDLYITMNTNQSSQSTNSAKWRPTIPVTGKYKVEVYIGSHAAFKWPCSPYSYLSYDTSDARYKIYYSGSSTTKVIDQKPLDHAWALLGTYTFNQGTAGYITLSDYNGETNLSRSISFNVVRFTWVGP